MVVGDNGERIAQAVRDSLARAQVVLTTGGLGPTVDDATREGIAEAAQVELVFHPEVWAQIQERFASFGRTPTENNRRQAYLPEGAQPLENPIGTAPGFTLEIDDKLVCALQGVPAEMRRTLQDQVVPKLRARLGDSGVIRSRRVRVAGMGESALDEKIADLERMSNPTVGLAAHPGLVDVRITAKAPDTIQADEMLWRIEATLRQRLGFAIYGVDDETLQAATLSLVAIRNERLVSVECGTGGALTGLLSDVSEVYLGGEVLPATAEPAWLPARLSQLRQEHKAQVGLGLHLQADERLHSFDIVIHIGDKEERIRRSYGGPPEYVARWATSYALDMLRRRLA
jgi:competence/damage-inducible protein CinA-like protein